MVGGVDFCAVAPPLTEDWVVIIFVSRLAMTRIETQRPGVSGYHSPKWEMFSDESHRHN
jgi:hypothetical protein